MCRQRCVPRVLLVLVTCCLGRPVLAASNTKCLSSVSRQNKSDTVLRIARHDWLSHNIVSSIAEVVLGEILGYTIEQVRPVDAATWGPDMAEHLYDIDLEQWYADHNGEQYRQYISRQKQVLDAGFLGYPGQSGLYTMRAALEQDPLADYYKFYQNGTTAMQLGFPSFRSSQLPYFLGPDFPECNLSWCGTGAFRGYWAPPHCSSWPDDCFEIMKPSVSSDQGYFEQIVKHNSVMGVFGYYGWELEEHLRSKKGESIVFYWWEPTLLLFQLDAIRIAFPDHYAGCDRNNTRNPNTGNVACDHREVALRKILTQRVRDVAPEAYLFLYRFSIETHVIRSLSLATAGNRSIEDVACGYVSDRQGGPGVDLPSCIINPVSQELGDGTLIIEVFNPISLECENVTKLPQLPSNLCFPAELRPGQVDRSHQDIYLSQKTWLSHNLATAVAEIVLREYMGINVINVNNLGASAFFGEQMASELYDVDMENWHLKPANRHYLDSGVVHFAGSIGYPGREGIYVATKALEQSALVDYYKYYFNATRAAQSGFAKHSDSNLHEVIGPSLCADYAWCGTGELEGYWVSPLCEANPDGCLELILGLPSWATGHVEQLVSNLGLEVVCGYYGNNIAAAVASYEARGLLIPFFAWEPDAWLSQVDAKRISFPDYSLGCLWNDTHDPSGPVTCDLPPLTLAKLVTRRVAESLKEAWLGIQSIEILLEDMNSMLALHVDAGGPLDSATAVACEYIKRNEAKVRAWAPDCLVRPPLPEDARINDSWFSQADGECMPLTCPPDRILTWVEALQSFVCTRCRRGEVADDLQLSCNPCGAGEESIDESTTRLLECRICAPGMYSLPESRRCSACDPGTYAEESHASSCEACPIGRAQSTLGSTECEECAAGHFADTVGHIQCDPCSPGDYKPNMTAPHRCIACELGKYTTEPGSSQCEDCAFGTTLLLGAHSPSFCGCPQDQFLLRLEEQEPRCVVCNRYMEPCQAGSTRTAYQLPGYSISIDGQTVYRCASEEACPRGPIGTCSAGSSGPGCADCEEGEYVWNGERCVECRMSTGIIAFTVPIIVILILLATHWYGNDPISYSFSSLSEFIVVVGLAATIFFYLNSFTGFDVEWQEPVRSVMRASLLVTRELTGFHINCSTTFSTFTNYVLMSLVPLVVAAVFCILAMARWAVPRKLFNTYATITYAVFLLLVLHALTPFRYIVHPIGGGKSLLYMPNVFEGSDEHSTMVLCGVCMILIYCVPFLTACMYATFKVGKSRHSLHRRWYLICFRFLFYKFQPEAYYWGLCVLLRNTLFGLMPSVAPDTPKIGLFALSMVAALSITHTAMVRPWRFVWMTNMDLGVLCYMLLVVNLAAGWVRESKDTDTVVANLLVSLGMICLTLVAAFAGSLLLKLLCASKEKLEVMRRTGLEAEEVYQTRVLKLIDEANREMHAEVAVVLDQLHQLQASSKKVHGIDVSKPLRVIAKEHVDLEHVVGIAASIRDEEYNLQHFFEDCMHTFPELRLYNMQEFRYELEKRGRRLSVHGLVPHRKLPPVSTQHLNTGGRSGAEEQLRTVGALFAVYALCRQDLDGKDFLSFGVDPVQTYKVLSPPSDVTREDLQDTTFFKMTPLQRRANFFWNFDWELMSSLLEQAGIAKNSDGKRLQLDVAKGGRLVAMLSLTAIHDIMKDASLCPTVADEPYQGVQVGEQIHDHDLALSYILDRHPDVLPSFRVLTEDQQRVIRFTQSEMGFNAGWLVQAEGPPSIVLSKLKTAIQTGGARREDVAFYFVHWVTDLAGAEPTPFTGSEKFAVKFPPFVLQGLLQCFSVVEELAVKSETQVYEDYLRRRWHEFAVREGDLPVHIDGEDAIARMRLVCMAQGGARAVLNAFDKLNNTDRLTLISELSETGLIGQKYSEQSASAPEAGTPFLLYYSPAWCQRAGQTHPDLTLRTLAEVFRQARACYPESCNAVADAENGIVCRTIQVGVLKTTDLESLAVAATLTDMFTVQRNSRLEGTLEVMSLIEV